MASHSKYLFPEMEAENKPTIKPTKDVKKSAKSLLRELYKIRAANPDNPLMPGLNKLISETRNFTNAAESQTEENVLYAIEKQMCWTIAEIVEETGISREAVKDFLASLISKNLVRKVKRYIPGSDRQYFMYKSNRQDVPEMSDL